MYVTDVLLKPYPSATIRNFKGTDDDEQVFKFISPL